MALATFHLLSRFGLGARPGDGLRDADEVVQSLLDELADPGATTLPDRLADTPELLRVYRAALAKDDTMSRLRAQRAFSDHMNAEFMARLHEARAVPTGLLVRLTMFWANHFAVQSGSNARVRTTAGAFEREAIRPHVLGRFADMALAATRHPTMLTSLDNDQSIGPNSPSGLRSGRGLNENHARELLELHTVGLEAGYTQADVTAFARLLTGWMVGRGGDHDGRFLFKPSRHEPGPHVLLGVEYGSDRDDRGAIEALANLSAHPATAWHIAAKLSRHFVADQPPQALVDDLARTFLESDGDLAVVTRRLVTHDLALSAPPSKLRSPQEYVLASLRVLDGNEALEVAGPALDSLGQAFWYPPSPKGYPDDAATWLAPDAMTTRLDIAADIAARAELHQDPRDLAERLMGPALSGPTRQAIARAETPQQAMALLLMSPEFQRR